MQRFLFSALTKYPFSFLLLKGLDKAALFSYYINMVYVVLQVSVGRENRSVRHSNRDESLQETAVLIQSFPFICIYDLY